MEIRFLNPDDAGEYWRLRMEALQTDPQAFGSSAEEHRLLPLDEVRRRIGAEGEDMFIAGAFEAGSLLGTAGFYREKGPKNRHKGRVWGVYVTPGARGKGAAPVVAKIVGTCRATPRDRANPDFSDEHANGRAVTVSIVGV